MRNCIFFLTDYIQSHFLLTFVCLDIIQIFSIHVKLEFRYFTLESILSSCIYTKTKRKRAFYIFSDRLYSEQFCFYNWGAQIIFTYFSISLNIEFLYFNERAYGFGVYTLKQSRIRHCIFFLTDYIQSNFVSNIGVSR